ncbi:hypothetical protein DRQ25_16750 [Candidatus Fermentibacteria bacterium]|nr:MAG: hypothetical protein DRQ25_16750 [Candidatus Fermentibacteria bacterium]
MNENTYFELNSNFGEAFDSLHFVTGALDKKSDRLFKTIIQVKDGIATGTDGQRLHMAKLDEDTFIIDGYYKVVKRTKTKLDLVKDDSYDMTYPDIRALFEIPTSGGIPLSEHNGHVYNAVKTICCKLHGNIAINYHFIEDILSYGVFDFHCTGEEEKPLFFTNGTKTAIVMPVIMNR